jgi:predicted GNAT superfamily acetyltransferase
MAERIASVKEPGILVRRLQETKEMDICVDLQRHVWGYSEIDTVPDQIVVVAKESRGQVLGAFHRGKAIGFALAFAAVHHVMVYRHSHMVGVVPEY